MSLTKRTTVLLTSDLHARLVAVAEQRGTSVGDLIRAACEEACRVAPRPGRVAAVRELGFLSLPDPTAESTHDLAAASEAPPP